MNPEFWLRGPVEGVPPLLMPVAHALLQAGADLRSAAGELSPDALWQKPGGAASVGFHLKHVVGSLDRLFTYADGKALTLEQLAAIPLEGEPGSPPASAEALLAGVEAAVAQAIYRLKEIREDDLLAARSVGRARLPTTVLGLLFHAAEHTQRHTGQVIATSKLLRSLGGRELAEGSTLSG